jgi:hypothetical protein
MPRLTTSKTVAKKPDPLVKQRQHSLSSSSEEMEVTTQISNNDWPLIRRTKRKRLYNTQPSVQTSQTETTNRFSMLTDDINTPEQTECPQHPIKHKPPPIFIHGVINYNQMVKRISEVY